MKLRHWIGIAAIIFCWLLIIFSAKAEAIATMPNQGQGKIVLTNEVCKVDGKTYTSPNRAYNYTVEGYGSEGCYAVEDDTVIVIWKKSDGSSQRMRYPLENFTLTKKSRSYGT